MKKSLFFAFSVFHKKIILGKIYNMLFDAPSSALFSNENCSSLSGFHQKFFKKYAVLYVTILMIIIIVVYLIKIKRIQQVLDWPDKK